MAMTTEHATVPTGDAATAVFILEPPRHVSMTMPCLTSGKYLIGSADDCQIQIAAQGIRPHHALLIVGDRKTLLKAWDEKTWINDWPVKESVLKPGDRISIGPVTLRWRAARADELAAIAQPHRAESKAEPTTGLMEFLVPASPRGYVVDAVWAEESQKLPPAVAQLVELEDIAPSAIVASEGAESRGPESVNEQATAPVSPRHDEQAARLQSWEARLQDRHESLEAERSKLARQAQRLEELTRTLDQRATALQLDISRQNQEWQTQEAELQTRHQSIQQEVVAREAELESRQQQIETWESRLSSRETELERREAGWATDIAEIRSVWETTQREGEQRLAEQIESLLAKRLQLEAELEVVEKLRADAEQTQLQTLQELQELAAQQAAVSQREQSLTDEMTVFAATQAAFAEQQSAAESAWGIEQAQAVAAQEAVACELNELRAALQAEQTRLDGERASLQDRATEIADERATLNADQQAIEDHRRELTLQISAVDARAHQYDELQARLSIEQEDILTARRELQADRLAIENDRASIAEERLALVAEREALLVEFDLGRQSHDQECQAERAAISEARAALDEARARLEADRTDIATAQAEFESRQRDWHAEIEERRTQLEEEQRRAAAEQEAKLAALAQEQEAWRSTIAVREEALSKQELEFATARELFATTQQQFEARQTQFEIGQADFADRVIQWETLQDELAAERELVIQQREALSLEVAEFESRQRLSLVQEADASRLAEQSAEFERARQALQVERDELAIAREKLTAAQEAFQAELSALRADWEARRESLIVAQSQLEVRQAELTAQATMLRGQQAALADSRAELEALQERSEQERLADAEITRLNSQLVADSQPESELQDAHIAELERLTSELTLAQEFQQTLESQLDGIRQRHEHDAAQWNSERTDWMVERDRLERELQSASRQLATYPSRPVCVDIPLNAESLPRIASGSMAISQSADPEAEEPQLSVDVAPRWQSSIAESFGISRDDHPDAEQIDSVDADVAETSDPVNQLRAELARMFDLKADQLFTDTPTRSELPVSDDPDNALLQETAVSDAPLSADDDWRRRLDGLRSEPATTVPPLAMHVPDDIASLLAETTQAPTATVNEEDSIASYMERLMARNRRSGNEADEIPAPATPVERSVVRESALRVSSSIDAPNSDEPHDDEMDAGESPRKARSRAVTDKDAAREHLQIFRQVANVSARTAVAKHTSQRLRMTLIVKGVVSLVCAAASGTFLYGMLAQQQPYLWQSVGCGVLAITVAVDLARNLWAIKRPVAVGESEVRDQLTLANESTADSTDAQ